MNLTLNFAAGACDDFISTLNHVPLNDKQFEPPQTSLLQHTLFSRQSVLYTMQLGFFDLLSTHGILHDHLSVQAAQYALGHHILNGLCATSSGHTCRRVAGSLSPLELVDVLSHDIIKHVSCLDMHQLHTLHASIGLRYKPFDSDLRQSLVDWMACIKVDASYTIDKTLDGLAAKNKSSLLALAAAHGLAASGSLSDIRDLISDHILNTHCQSILAFGAPVCEDLSSDFIGEGSLVNAEIAVLYMALNKLSLKPLQKLLSSRHISFDPLASLNQL